MRSWSVQDAKARFSEMLDVCLSEGPQQVTRRGLEAAVLVPVEDWRRLSEKNKSTLKDILLAEGARAELQLPQRGKNNHRQPPVFK
jgi:antitoxin Phd